MTFNLDALIRDVKIAYKSLSSSEHASSISSKPADNPSKSTAKAQSLRETGNRFYKEQKVEDALYSYTKCIAYALEGSEELGKAYGNRSAVLFGLKKYAPCLLDINRALKNQCTELLRQKLLDRKERCLALMKSSVGGSGDADDEIDEDGTNPPTNREPSWRADVFSQFSNPFIPNASPKIKLKYDKKWGRHFVATADIQPGETLFIENYFVVVLFADDSRYKYCDLCVAPCDALIPCLSCAKTMYCSDQCRVRAYDLYHRMECKLSFLSSSVTIYEAIANRLFLLGTEQGAALENLMNTLSIRDIFAENFDFSGKPTGSDYLTALRLTRGAFSESRLKPFIEYAVKFVTLLRKNAFFEHVPSDRLKEAEIFTMALLLNNYTERFVNGFNEPGCKSANVAKGGMCYGLLLLQYLFNHSCNPNTSGYRNGREFIVFNTRPVKKDEQLFVSYCNEFLSAPKAERTKLLTTFTCRCEACLNDWPTGSELRMSPTTTYDQMKKMFEGCIQCDDLREAGRVLSEVMGVVVPLLDETKLLNLGVAEILRIVVEMTSLLYKVMGPTSFPLVDLKYCLLTLKEYYYDDLERESIQNKKVKFPGSLRNIDESLTNEMWAIIGRTMPSEQFFTQAITTVFDSTTRIEYYLWTGRFIPKKMIG